MYVGGCCGACPVYPEKGPPPRTTPTGTRARPLSTSTGDGTAVWRTLPYQSGLQRDPGPPPPTTSLATVSLSVLLSPSPSLHTISHSLAVQPSVRPPPLYLSRSPSRYNLTFSIFGFSRRAAARTRSRTVLLRHAVLDVSTPICIQIDNN